MQQKMRAVKRNMRKNYVLFYIPHQQRSDAHQVAIFTTSTETELS